MSEFSCPACSRSFSWKPELAGRRAKCKCGNVLDVPAEAPQAAVEPAVLDVVPAVAQQPRCPSCEQAMEAKAVLCVNCGYDLRTGRHVGTAVSSPQAASAAPMRAPSATNRAAAMGYPTSRRPTQEEPAGSTKMYVMLGAALLLVAMGVGGWIIFKGTGGGQANKPKLGDDARVEQMINDDYPKDLTEWVDANPARMLGGKNARQAAAIEVQLKKLGATRVLAFGPGVLCLCIAIELPDAPAQRKALFDWQNQSLQLGEPRAKDVGQRYILHNIGL